MKEIKGNIFDFIEDEDTDAICITTNGITNASGVAIMGAGTAGEAVKRYPKIREITGKQIKAGGNKTHLIGVIDNQNNYQVPAPENVSTKDYKCLIFSFPTKEDFRHPAIPELIVQSAKRLVKFADYLDLKKIVIPAPGVGAATGKLNWEKDVKPLIKDILDDRFVIVFLEE